MEIFSNFFVPPDPLNGEMLKTGDTLKSPLGDLGVKRLF